MALRDLLQRAGNALHGVHGGHHQPKANVRCAQDFLVQQGLHRFGQRFHIQAARPDDVHHILAQLFRRKGFRQLNDIVQIQRAPEFFQFLHLAHGQHGTVQRAHAGPGDEFRLPIQLLQGAVRAHLIAALGPAPGEHQRFARLCHGCILPDRSRLCLAKRPGGRWLCAFSLFVVLHLPGTGRGNGGPDVQLKRVVSYRFDDIIPPAGTAAKYTVSKNI